MNICQPCETCLYLHDMMYGDYHLHCAPHPYGPPREFCPDWKKDNGIVTQRTEAICFPLLLLSEAEALVLREQQASIEKKLHVFVIWMLAVFVLVDIILLIAANPSPNFNLGSNKNQVFQMEMIN